MIAYVIGNPLTWYAVGIVAVCIVGIDVILRPIWEEFVTWLIFFK